MIRRADAKICAADADRPVAVEREAPLPLASVVEIKCRSALPRSSANSPPSSPRRMRRVLGRDCGIVEHDVVVIGAADADLRARRSDSAPPHRRGATGPRPRSFRPLHRFEKAPAERDGVVVADALQARAARPAPRVPRSCVTRQHQDVVEPFEIAIGARAPDARSSGRRARPATGDEILAAALRRLPFARSTRAEPGGLRLCCDRKAANWKSLRSTLLEIGVAEIE